MNEKEQQFYQALGQVPEVPGMLYDGVKGGIRRRMIRDRILLSGAAAVLLLFGVTMNLDRIIPYDNGMDTEVAYELQIIHDYLNGDDINTDDSDVMGELVVYQQEGY